MQVPDLHHAYVWMRAEQTAWYKKEQPSPSANGFYYSDKYLSEEVRQSAAAKVPRQAQIALGFGKRPPQKSTATALKPKKTVSWNEFLI